MATYGPGGSRRASKSNRSSASGQRTSSISTRPHGVRRETDPTKKMDVRNDLRGAIDGRESEFIGIGLIAAGLLLALAIYFNLAGPLGRGVETLIGWFTGVG